MKRTRRNAARTKRNAPRTRPNKRSGTGLKREEDRKRAIEEAKREREERKREAEQRERDRLDAIRTAEQGKVDARLDREAAAERRALEKRAERLGGRPEQLMEAAMKAFAKAQRLERGPLGEDSPLARDACAVRRRCCGWRNRLLKQARRCSRKSRHLALPCSGRSPSRVPAI